MNGEQKGLAELLVELDAAGRDLVTAIKQELSTRQRLNEIMIQKLASWQSGWQKEVYRADGHELVFCIYPKPLCGRAVRVRASDGKIFVLLTRAAAEEWKEKQIEELDFREVLVLGRLLDGTAKES